MAHIAHGNLVHVAHALCCHGLPEVCHRSAIKWSATKLVGLSLAVIHSQRHFELHKPRTFTMLHYPLGHNERLRSYITLSLHNKGPSDDIHL